MWDDTVNTASRMESGGTPGRIQVTPTTHELLAGNGYTFENRGTIEVKGKGQVTIESSEGRQTIQPIENLRLLGYGAGG